jgi:hypothetical protein
MRLAFCLVLACCGGRKVGPPIETGHPVGTTLARPDGGAPPAKLVATLGDKAIGPYLAMGDAGGMVVYLATEGSARTLVALPVDAYGAPTADARALASVPIDSATLVLRSIGSSFVAAWTALTDRGEAVMAVGIAPDGKAIAAPVELARTTDDIVWIEIVPTRSGAIALWAEETQRSGANVLAVALDGNGKPRGVPSHAARGVSGWQSLSSSAGAVLAVLQPDLAWIRLDADGHPIGSPAVLGPAGKDMDVVRTSDGYVVAWTERSGPEPAVRAIVVDETGKLRFSRDLTLGRGAGTLTALASGSSGAMVAWEESRGRKGPRRIHADVLDAGELSLGATLTLQNGNQPEIAATKDGFAMLASTRLCAASDTQEQCLAAGFSPGVIAFDARGAITGGDVLPLAEIASPSFAWNLACGAKGCVVLEATSEPKTRVFAAPVLLRAGSMKVAATPAPPPDAPEIAALETIASGAAVIDVASTQVGGGWLASIVVANEDGATATLTVRALDGSGSTIVSKRALPIGGVAMAASEDSAAIAWVTRDANDPQVHVTKVDRHAKKLAELQLTTAKGDAGDVALAFMDGGFVVAWVDARDGNGEVYAARIGKDFQRPQRQERLTSAPGDATDLTMFASGDLAWLAWADPRESPKDGFADIWVSAIGSDAKIKVAEQRVLPTAAHSRSPSLCKSGTGVAVAWIEEAPAGADPKTTLNYGAMLALLDETGKRSEPIRITTAGEGFATGVWLDPRSNERVRGVLSRATTDDLHLDAFEAGARLTVAWPLVLLDGPPSLDVPLAYAGDALLFGDDGPTPADRRLRRTVLRWKR